MHHITFTFAPIREPINGRFVTARGIHGMLFNILAQADREESNWLHKHGAPRPFSFVPLYSDEGHLAGMRLAAITERAATLFIRTGEWFQKEGHPCHLGGQEFIIQEVTQAPGLRIELAAVSLQPTSKTSRSPFHLSHRVQTRAWLFKIPLIRQCFCLSSPNLGSVCATDDVLVKGLVGVVSARYFRHPPPD